MCTHINICNPTLEGCNILQRILRHALTIRELIHAPLRLDIIPLAPILSSDVVKYRTEDIVRECLSGGILVQEDVMCRAEAEERELAELDKREAFANPDGASGSVLGEIGEKGNLSCLGESGSGGEDGEDNMIQHRGFVEDVEFLIWATDGVMDLFHSKSSCLSSCSHRGC
jgi:hypothetical protein